MSRILEGLDGVVCQMDKGLYLDTLRRDTITTYKTLPHIAAAGLTLNKEKYASIRLNPTEGYEQNIGRA